MKNTSKTEFVPILIIPSAVMELDFYKHALGAIELRSFKNDNGSYHVSEMEIDGAMFHFHQERPAAGFVTRKWRMVLPLLLA